MVRDLKETIPEAIGDLTQFILDERNPDLCKLDAFLNELMFQTDTFNQLVEETAKSITDSSLTDTWSSLFGPKQVAETSSCSIQ